MTRTLRLLCILLLGWPALAGAFTTDSAEDICAQSYVVYCENFENRTVGSALTNIIASQFKNPGWAVSDGSMAVTTGDKFDGSKSLVWTLGAGTGGAGYFDFDLPSRRDYYVRFYLKTESNWVWSTDGNKMMYIGSPTYIDNVMFDQATQYGGDVPTVFMQNAVPPANEHISPNVSNYHWRLNDWVCVEGHFTNNSTAGGSDGALEAWFKDSVVDVKVFQYAGIKVDSLASVLSHMKFSGYWNAGTGPAHPTTHRWIDNIVVATQRIGCLGAPVAGDTTPPTAVTNPVATANGSAAASLSWTNGADTVGVTGVNVRRCTGASCTPSTILTTLGVVSSYLDGTLAPSTTYGWAFGDFDAAGNQGAYSSTVYATTTANTTTRTPVLSDAFTRANNADIGANYDAGYTGVEALQLLTNAIRPTTTNDAVETYNGALTADQYTQATISTISGATTDHIAALVRWAAPPTLSGYACVARKNGSFTSAIRRYTAGAATALTSENATGWAATDTLMCEVVGSTVRLYRNGVLLLSATDSTYTSGRGGLWLDNGNSAADTVIDDAVFGNVGAVAAPTPPTLTSVTAVDTTGATIAVGGSAPTTVLIFDDLPNDTVVKNWPADFPAGRYTYPKPLTPGLTFIKFVPQDAAGVNNLDGAIAVSLVGIAPAADTTAPVRTNTTSATNLPAGTTSGPFSLTTDELGACKWDTTDPTGTPAERYAALANTMTTQGLTHSGSKGSLTNGSSTPLYVYCADTVEPSLNGPNINATALVITLVVDSVTTDTTPPPTVTNLACSVIGPTQESCHWDAVVDAGGTVTYQLYLSLGAGNTTYVLAGQPTAATTIIANLPANTIVNSVVKAIDPSLNFSVANSNVSTVTTQAAIDLTPPSTMTNLRSLGVFQKSVVLTWDNGTDNAGPVTTTIERATGACSTYTSVVSNLTLSQLIVALTPSTSYCFRGKFSDGSGNSSVDYSNVLSVTTTSSGLILPRTQVPFSQPRSGLSRDRTPRVP